MTGFRYAPGEWWGVAAGGAAIALAPETPPEAVTRVLEALRAGSAIGGVLGVLAESTGADLLSLPSFALLTATGRTARLVLRGVNASVAGEPVTGVGVLTWTEHEVPADASVVVVVGGTRVEPGLEIADGVGPLLPLVVDDGVTVVEPAAPPAAVPQPAEPAAHAEQLLDHLADATLPAAGTTFLPAPLRSSAQ